jgi:hypothetical protein
MKEKGYDIRKDDGHEKQQIMPEILCQTPRMS